MDSQLDRHTRATTRKRALHKVDEVLQEFVCQDQINEKLKRFSIESEEKFTEL